MCVLLPNEQHGLFQKCANLLALESIYSHCDVICTNKFVDECLLLLSQFPSLIHVTITLDGYYHKLQPHATSSQLPDIHITSPQLPDVLTSCQKLKYLRYVQYCGNKPFLVPTHAHNLEQIESKDTDLSDAFLSTISAHGGLVHVVLYVNSVTKKGVCGLVQNSPKLMGFHAFLYDEDIKVNRIYKFVIKQFLIDKSL